MIVGTRASSEIHDKPTLLYVLALLDAKQEEFSQIQIPLEMLVLEMPNGMKVSHNGQILLEMHRIRMRIKNDSWPQSE